ncbi:MAG: FAD-dependent oxidoreductase [Saprospiraceae bacterium]|nr:FAD-dependent oxidoreductase [Saprospiraceae bacterium]
MQTSVAIIGGGLTGLTLAYLLDQRSIDFRIIEARSRLGGRILTARKPGHAPIEKGATWLGNQHTQLSQLLLKLGLEPFEQQLGINAIYEPISTSPHQLVQLPPNTNPSFRIRGGSSTLVEALAAQIGSERILTGMPVTAINTEVEGISVITPSDVVHAETVVSTLPPNLLMSSISLPEALPKEITTIAKSTHTWMGDSIKVGLRFPKPFWRAPSLSGTIFSNVGPIPEMYDHSDFEDTHFALKGFLNSSYHAADRAMRHNLVRQQLRKYYGPAIEDASEFVELSWRNEPYTFAEYENHVLPHQNNGHEAYRSAYLNGRFWIGGSETASRFPGYMEGAVNSAQYLFEQLSKGIYGGHH